MNVSKRSGGRVDGRDIELSQEAIALLCRRSWPGNVRQLRKVLAPLAIFAEGSVITPDVINRLAHEDDEEELGRPLGELSRYVPAGGQGNGPATRAARMILDMPGADEDGNSNNKLQLIEDALFTEALARTGGHQARAAELLGVHRKVVGRWAEKKREEKQQEGALPVSRAGGRGS